MTAQTIVESLRKGDINEAIEQIKTELKEKSVESIDEARVEILEKFGFVVEKKCMKEEEEEDDSEEDKDDEEKEEMTEEKDEEEESDDSDDEEEKEDK